MEDALTRLETAIKLAMVKHVVGADDQLIEFTNCKRRLATTLSVEGQRNGFDLITDVSGYDAFSELLPLRDDREGRRGLHPIWTDPGFIMPAVAALAQFWDRMITPDGDSLLTLAVEQSSGETLYGYRLKSLTMSAYAPDGAGGWDERQLTDADRRRVSTILAGAASFYLREQDWMQFAPFYMRVEAERSAPEGAFARNVRGSASSFIELV